MSWLDPVRAALDAAPAPVPVFFRDDDAGWDDDRLVAMLDRFARAGVAVDVAVIPAAITTRTVQELTARAVDGVHVHQHGYRHVDHETAVVEGSRKHEFGAARSRAAQVEDVLAGRRIMIDAFGEAVEPIFTPPWNRCTSDTAAAAAYAGMRVLSRDVTAKPIDPAGLAQVPVTVDWFGQRKGVRWTRDELGDKIAADVARGGPLGVMLHHAVTEDDELAALDDLLALVAAHDRAGSTSILAVAELGAAT